MCMAVPMKLVKKNGAEGEADLGGVVRKVRLDFVPEVEIGDYVLVHAGFAIEVVDEEQAQETLALFAEMLQVSPEEMLDE